MSGGKQKEIQLSRNVMKIFTQSRWHEIYGGQQRARRPVHALVLHHPGNGVEVLVAAAQHHADPPHLGARHLAESRAQGHCRLAKQKKKKKKKEKKK